MKTGPVRGGRRPLSVRMRPDEGSDHSVTPLRAGTPERESRMTIADPYADTGAPRSAARTRNEGLDSVPCSPFRALVARLEIGRAALEV